MWLKVFHIWIILHHCLDTTNCIIHKNIPKSPTFQCSNLTESCCPYRTYWYDAAWW